MHATALFGGEVVAAVHGGAVVPDHHVTDLPFLVPGVFRQGAVVPELVEETCCMGRIGLAHYAMVAPVQILLLAFIFVPSLYVAWLNLHHSSYGQIPTFVGFAN